MRFVDNKAKTRRSKLRYASVVWNRPSTSIISSSILNGTPCNNHVPIQSHSSTADATENHLPSPAPLISIFPVAGIQNATKTSKDDASNNYLPSTATPMPAFPAGGSTVENTNATHPPLPSPPACPPEASQNYHSEYCPKFSDPMQIVEQPSSLPENLEGTDEIGARSSYCREDFEHVTDDHGMEEHGDSASQDSLDNFRIEETTHPIPYILTNDEPIKAFGTQSKEKGHLKTEVFQSKKQISLDTWQGLIALILVTGSIRFSRKQYNFVRLAIFCIAYLCTDKDELKETSSTNTHSASSEQPNDVSSRNPLPSYSTVYRSLQPAIQLQLGARHKHLIYNHVTSKAHIPNCSNPKVSNHETLLRFIPVSEFARLDVSFPPFLTASKETDSQSYQPNATATSVLGVDHATKPGLKHWSCIDDWPLIANRFEFFGSTLFIHAHRPLKLCHNWRHLHRAYPGDVISFEPRGFPALLFQLSFPYGATNSQYRMTGVISIIWIAGSTKWRTETENTANNPTMSHIPSDDTADSTQPREAPTYAEQSSDSQQYFSSSSEVADRVTRDQRKSNGTSPSSPNVTYSKNQENSDETIKQSAASAESRTNMPPIIQFLMNMYTASVNAEKPRPFVTCEKEPSNNMAKLFGAGDMISIICPSVGRSNIYVVLVNRFNVKPGEYDEQIFMIEEDSESQSSSEYFNRYRIVQSIDEDDNVIRDVCDVSIVSNGDTEDWDRRRVPSTSGKLSDGRRYFIYRFLLYWDGFNVSETGVRSMEGIYLLPLNLPTRCRASSRAVRVLSIIPKGIPASVVLRELLDDIGKGMTEGFNEIDAEGNEITIFLDMIGCTGDTPALNSVIDVKGRNAASCCHICRFRRLEVKSVSIMNGKVKLHRPKYMCTEHHGGKAYCMRSTDVHKTIQESGIDEESMKHLGMKNVVDEPFLSFPNEFRKLNGRMPKTEYGVSVVPNAFDCYQSLLIGSDHLIFGHAKNCINAVLALLPSASYVQVYGSIAQSLLQDARLRAQGSFVNKKEKKLNPMTITEVFSLLFMSERAFRLSLLICKKQTNANDPDETQRMDAQILPTVLELCNKAIDVVASFAKLTARLWFLPRVEEDGITAVKAFNEHNGIVYLRETQKMIENHLARLRECSTYDENDLKRYLVLVRRVSSNSSGIVKKEKVTLEKVLTFSHTMRTFLDVPNVHRLLEVGYVLLPMVGSITRVTELEFESGHQALKRAVENSNKHDAHLQALTASVMNDWKGRLSMLTKVFDESDMTVFRALVRLIRGPSYIKSCDGKIGSDDKEMLKNVLGPKGVIGILLRTQRLSVMNDRKQYSKQRFWEAVPFTEKEKDHLNFRHPYLPLTPNVAHDASKWALCKTFIEEGERLLIRVYDSPKWNRVRCAAPRNNSKEYRNVRFKIHPGDVIQSVGAPFNRRIPIVQTYDPDIGIDSTHVSYYCVLSLNEIYERCVAVVLPCVIVTGELQGSQQEHRINNCVFNLIEQEQSTDISTKNLYHLLKSKRDVKLLTLTRSTQRVFVEHNCDKDCLSISQNDSIEFKHSEHILDGKFTIKDRRSGFPPRAA